MIQAKRVKLCMHAVLAPLLHGFSGKGHVYLINRRFKPLIPPQNLSLSHSERLQQKATSASFSVQPKIKHWVWNLVYLSPEIVSAYFFQVFFFPSSVSSSLVSSGRLLFLLFLAFSCLLPFFFFFISFRFPLSRFFPLPSSLYFFLLFIFSFISMTHPQVLFVLHNYFSLRPA